MEKEGDYENFKCPICYRFLEDPVELTTCGHRYCKKCISIIATNPKPKCPSCTAPFEPSYIQEASIIKKQMTEKTIPCKCGKSFTLDNYNLHEDSCAVLNNELKEVTKKMEKECKDKNYVNQLTFKCYFCPVNNLDRDGLIKHTYSLHKGKPGICPICITMPYGDKNFVSQNLSSHLHMRHKYDMLQVVSSKDDEDDDLKRALEESLKCH